MGLKNGLLSTIGKTPLVRLEKLFPDFASNFYAKLEMFNPGGSSKDRTAWLMVSKAFENGKISQNSTIIESSSGNMAIGLAQVCRYFGLSLIVVTDPNINQRAILLLQVYGAQIERVTEADSDGNYLNNRLERVAHLLDTIHDSYSPNQYYNDLNIAAHYETMREIVNNCPEPPNYILAATSTCGTIMGCARYVHEHNLDTKIVAVDAVGSAIFGSSKCKRLIPGHGAGRKSDLLDESLIDHVLHISDIECVIGCRRLLKREAILAGGSAGAVVMASEKLNSIIPQDSNCVMILADSGERYLDTIYNDHWVESHFDRIDDLGIMKPKTENEPQKTPVLVNGFEFSIDHSAGENGTGKHYS